MFFSDKPNMETERSYLSKVEEEEEKKKTVVVDAGTPPTDV